MRAVVLTRSHEGEDSLTLEVYSYEHGREILRVRAASQMHSKLRAGTGTFSTVDAAETILGKHGLLAVSLVPVKLRPGLGQDFTRLLGAFSVVEAISQCTPEGLPEPGLFELLESTLDGLAQCATGDLYPRVLDFFLKAFGILGVGEESDITSLEKIEARAQGHFSVSLPTLLFFARLSQREKLPTAGQEPWLAL